MIISVRTTLLANLLTLLATFLLSTGFVSAAQTITRTTRESYIDQYRHIAIDHQQRYGIPASITMAQGILESDSGNSYLSRRSNNHFGIKCKSDWKGRSVRHDDDAANECFRAYDRVEQSYEDHAKFLDSSPRYDSLFKFSPTDYKSWARGLKGAGYATAPDYTARLVKIIEDSKLYLLDTEAVDGTKAYDAMLAANAGKEAADSQADMQPTPKGVDPNNYQVSIASHAGYSIYKTNHSRYVTAKNGDTYASIAKQFDTPKKAIAKYNDSKKYSTELIAGDVVYIEHKQNKWNGNLRNHRVADGETIHSISQSYAIQERSLRRLNDLKRNHTAAVGSVIKLRK